MNAFSRLTIGVAALATASCATTPVQSPTVDVSGQWAGDWVCDDPSVGSGLATLNLTQSGSKVNGTAVVTASERGINRTSDSLRGTVAGDQFILQEWTDLTGTFAVTGDRISGPFKGVLCLGKLNLARRGTAPVAAAPMAPVATGYGLRAATVDYLAVGTGLPPNAKPGECYAQATVAAQYETTKERVLKKAASSRVEVVPAQFQEVEERVMVRPASKRLEVVQAQVEEIEERVMVQPASKRLEAVPATFRTETERVLVRPAYTVWKRSSELTEAERAQQRIDPVAGDILCLVDVPAEYATVSREVVATPATTREVEVPAEYATVKKTAVKTPAAVREVEVPAEYRTVKIKKMVTPAREVRTEIPAEYGEVTKQVVKVPASVAWREVLCETNATPQTLQQMQVALKRAGYDPGREDGRFDSKTMGAVRSFQQAKGLPVDSAGYVNMATVKALGVTP